MPRFPYTRISSPDLLLPDIVRFKYHSLIKIGLLNDSAYIRVEAYIDTGSQWCLFNNDLAKRLGIKDYKDTKEYIPLSGIGGKQPGNRAYFHDLKLAIFKDSKGLKLQNAWVIDTKIGFLENPIGFAGILGVYGFLDQFSFKTNIPEGYFEIEPIFE
jgi:hypothetical protein